MSVQDKCGGPAFPEPLAIGPSGDTYPAYGGMSLRDYFAAKALVATYLNGFAGPSNERRAALCYEMADAMLEARK